MWKEDPSKAHPYVVVLRFKPGVKILYADTEKQLKDFMETIPDALVLVQPFVNNNDNTAEDFVKKIAATHKVMAIAPPGSRQWIKRIEHLDGQPNITINKYTTVGEVEYWIARNRPKEDNK